MSSEKECIKKEAAEWRQEKANVYKEYVRASVIGLEVGLSLITGIVGGFFFDRHFKSDPWGIIVGAILGVGAAGKSLYRFSKAYLKEHGSNSDQS
jgi:F0F1-type ATP synthase assembly protein I